MKKLTAVILLTFGCAFSGVAMVSADATQNTAPHTPTLKFILSKYFDTTDIHMDEERRDSGMYVKKLWEALGIKKEEVSWEVEGEKEKRVLFFDDPSDDHVQVFYRFYESGNATPIQDEYVIVQISESFYFHQLLFFRKRDDDWEYATHAVFKDQMGTLSGLEFHRSGDGALFFSMKEDFPGIGTGLGRDDIVFFKLIHGNLKQVLDTTFNGYSNGGGEGFFSPHYEAEGPLFNADFSIEFTYGVRFEGWSTHYDSKYGDPDGDNFDLFSSEKKAVFVWDDKAEEYRLDDKRSQFTTQDEIDKFCLPDNKEFYAMYKNKIELLKTSGNEQQKEWAREFEKEVE